MTSRPTAAAFLDSFDPATGETIARFEITSPADVPGILDHSRKIQREWARVAVSERCRQLRRLRDVLYARRHEVSEIITRESGKPRLEALFADVLVTLDTADYFARHGEKLLRPERVPHHNPAMKSKVGRLHYEPFGVVGIISPWNYPLAVPMTQIIPALAAGNAVILKPSELTPWCGALIGELFAQAEFPGGLVQVIQGGGETGAALVEPAGASGCDKIIFTGSVATGRRVAEGCARRLIPSVLELGGKDAMIVLAEADLESASSAAVWGSFTNCGQACLSVERIYVEQSIAEKFAALCVEKTKRLKVGNGLDGDVEIGPLIHRAQRERVEDQLADAVRHGAQILTGGTRLEELGENFYAPTVVIHVNHSMALMREETFGPVLAICAVKDADEAVRLANDSPFALSASVWTRDARIGKLLASRLDAGAVMVNDVLSYFGICEAPHGGRRASGWGRTHGRHGLHEVVQVKYVDVERLPRHHKGWWFGYSESLASAADRFVEFLFASRLGDRLAGLRNAKDVLFRKDRV